MSNELEVKKIIATECVERTAEEFFAYLASISDTKERSHVLVGTRVFGSFMNEVWAVVRQKLANE